MKVQNRAAPHEGRVPAIEVTDLVKRYGDVRAVDGVSFTVGQGEFFGILGPNAPAEKIQPAGRERA